jgi:hypothetical protein
MTGRETVLNKPLTGTEVKELMTRDFERLIANDGMLAPHLAFGRIGWSISISKHLENPYHPEEESIIRSFPTATNLLDANPEQAAIDTYPLSPPVAPDSLIDANTLHRTVDSPNAERIREGLPLDAEVRQLDGTKTIEQVTYPPLPDLGEGNYSIEDTSEAAQRAWEALNRPEEVK